MMQDELNVSKRERESKGKEKSLTGYGSILPVVMLVALPFSANPMP